MKAGDRVTVFNQTPSGKTIIEGPARLVNKLESLVGQERWEVEFVDEPGELFERLIILPQFVPEMMKQVQESDNGN